MKLIPVILLLTFSVAAQMPPRVMGDLFEAFASSGTTSGITLDWSKGFESGILETGLTETDTQNKLDYAATAKYHSGSKSMSLTLDADGIVAYLTKDFGSEKTNCAVSFWYYFPSGVDWDIGPRILALGDSPIGSYNLAVYGTKAGTDYYFRIRRYGGTMSGNIYVPASNAWYRVEVQYAKTGTSTLSIYNVAGSQVSTNVSLVVAGGYTSRYMHIGWLDSQGTARGNTAYWDDVGVKFNGTSPLWPFTPSD